MTTCRIYSWNERMVQHMKIDQYNTTHEQDEREKHIISFDAENLLTKFNNFS